MCTHARGVYKTTIEEFERGWKDTEVRGEGEIAQTQ